MKITSRPRGGRALFSMFCSEQSCTLMYHDPVCSSPIMDLRRRQRDIRAGHNRSQRIMLVPPSSIYNSSQHHGPFDPTEFLDPERAAPGPPLGDRAEVLQPHVCELALQRDRQHDLRQPTRSASANQPSA
jgi:hypothetical protein